MTRTQLIAALAGSLVALLTAAGLLLTGGMWLGSLSAAVAQLKTDVGKLQQQQQYYHGTTGE